MPRDTEAIKKRTAEKHKKLKDRFVYLYDKKHLRYDFAIAQVAEEFSYALSTVERIINYGTK